jgi:3'-phosphoadenosine 5'-phosphosulfate sulfotransferase (PAPS reductase)/FAD synthetase
MAPTVDLRSYDVILVNTSAGKDSQAMLDLVVEQARAAGVADRLVAVHADLGRVEWQGTKELAAEQCAHYGVRFEVVRRPEGDLLSHVEARGMWMSSAARYCTSDHKRGQCYKLITQLVADIRRARGLKRFRGGAPVRVLNCLGLRAGESDKRAARAPFEFDVKASNGLRVVDTWLPIHAWSEAEVWARIKHSGVRHHFAYDLGMPRLSCVFCIFAPPEALVLAGQHNQALLAEYVRVEKAIDHAFTVDVRIADIQAAVLSGAAAPAGPVGSMAWAQCA